MLKWIFSLLLLMQASSSLFALEISINSAREDHQRYSILHLKDSSEFACQEITDDFNRVIKIVCAYSKQPTQSIKKLQNDFFEINSIIKNKTFFLIITPLQKIELLPVIFNLNDENTTYQPSVSIAKHWMIIGYKEKLPLIHSKVENQLGINFPFYLDKDNLPFVGSLDIKGNPVYIQKVEDVTEYLKIKKYFNSKEYDKILELIDEVLLDYPNSLFKAELLYYKIKAYSKLEDSDNVIDISKVYLREYSSDENIPEVLSLTAKAYSKIGLNTDADYFFDRLFSEHEKSIFTQWGYIYKGEMFEASGGTTAATAFYKKALNETEDLTLGATAAYFLAHMNIASSHRSASEYMMKILNAKPDFLMNDLKTSIDMMHVFGDREDYLTASAMAKALSDAMTKQNDEYEVLLKERALWLSKTEDKIQALEAINKYVKEYPDGDYINEIQVVKDALFFDTNESNVTIRLQEYQNLMEDYQNDAIGDRATYEKAKLLLESNACHEVLDMKEALLALEDAKYMDIESIIKDSAICVMEEALEKKKCHEALGISNDYNITLSNKWDDGLYDCAMKGGDYSLAKLISSKNLKSSDLELRKKWLYRYVKVDFATGNYSDVIEASKDLISLISDEKESPYEDVYRDIFDTYQRLEQNDNMIKAIMDIEKRFGVNYKDLDRFVSVMTIGFDNKDNNLLIKYGSYAMEIQTKAKAFPQSPLVEFTLYQVYMEMEDFNKALETIKSLDGVSIDKTQRARQKYLLGTVYSKLWRDEDAKKAYKESMEAEPTSPWGKLAKSAVEI